MAAGPPAGTGCHIPLAVRAVNSSQGMGPLPISGYVVLAIITTLFLQFMSVSISVCEVVQKKHFPEFNTQPIRTRRELPQPDKEQPEGQMGKNEQ